MQVTDINPFVRYAGRNFLSSTPLRRARDQRMFYIASKESQWHIDGASYNFSRGTLFYLPAGTPYCMEASDKFGLIAVNFDFTQVAAHQTTSLSTVSDEDFALAGAVETLSFEKDFFCVPMFVSGNVFEQKMDALVSEFEEKKIYFREKTSAILKDILVEMLRLSADNSEENLAADKMITYIRENYMLPITNKDIASCVRYHEYHANRLMLRHTGTTLHKYLTDYRIERAKMYLTSTKRRILCSGRG